MEDLSHDIFEEQVKENYGKKAALSYTNEYFEVSPNLDAYEDGTTAVLIEAFDPMYQAHFDVKIAENFSKFVTPYPLKMPFWRQ